MAQKRLDQFEDARDTALDALADAVQHLHRQQERTEKTTGDEDEDEPRSGDEGDFAQDFLDLNVQYLNQLARLGSSYSVVASRTLEKLYDHFAPKEPTESTAKRAKRDAPLIVGRARDTRHFLVKVRNKTGQMQNTQLTLGGSAVGAASFVRGAASLNIELFPRERLTIECRIDFQSLEAGKTHELSLALVPNDDELFELSPTVLLLKRADDDY